MKQIHKPIVDVYDLTYNNIEDQRVGYYQTPKNLGRFIIIEDLTFGDFKQFIGLRVDVTEEPKECGLYFVRSYELSNGTGTGYVTDKLDCVDLNRNIHVVD